jgi:drug/metabolite transporter (DMT)-like permease
MPRWKAVLATIFGALFVVGGIVLLRENDPESRSVAIGTIVFFGACTVTGILTLFPQMFGVDSRWRTLALAFASLALAVGCFFVAPLARAEGDTALMYSAWAGAAFFGLGGMVIAWSAVR